MDYFAPGLRDLARRIGRQGLSLRTRFAHRQLARAETTLGLLGWQQADFDENTQAQVDRIIEYEREQSRATNESASVGRVLREQEEMRAVGQRHFATERNTLEKERERLESEGATAREQLEEKRLEEPTFAERLPELDREMRACSRRHEELRSIAGHSAAVKQELLELRARAAAIPNEVASLRAAQQSLLGEIRALERRSEAQLAELAALEARERELKEAFTRADEELAAKIDDFQRQRTAFDEAYTSLEGAKDNPYREVGRVLADNGIAPMNQPQALEKVRRERFRVQECADALALSLAGSAAEDPVEIRQSLLLWSGILVGAVLFVIALIVLG